MSTASLPPLAPPHTRVGVGGVLVRSGRVVVNRAVYRTRFTIPSGYVDPGESLEGALVREWQEETGMTVRIGPLLLTRHKVVDEFQSDVYFAFALEHVAGEPVARPPRSPRSERSRSSKRSRSSGSRNSPVSRFASVPSRKAVGRGQTGREARCPGL